MASCIRGIATHAGGSIFNRKTSERAIEISNWQGCMTSHAAVSSATKLVALLCRVGWRWVIVRPLTIASLQVGDFFATCNLIATGANRNIETDGIVEIGETHP